MRDLRFWKLVVLLNAGVPGAVLLWDVWHGRAGANPENYAILTTGLLTLIFLCLTLLVTPLRKITGFQWLFHFRRTLGLLAFFYGLTHFSIFFLSQQGGSVHDTLSEMVKRKYLIVGSLALLSMAPLAATSFNFMIRRMGAKNWHRLHRLVYATAALGALHFMMQGKVVTRLSLAYATVVSALLGYRGVMYFVERSGRKLAARGETGRWSGKLRVERIVQETPDVRTFRLVGRRGRLPFEYEAGQYLTVTLDVAGKKVRRNYTIASTPTRAGFCEVTIKREAMGAASRHMHDVVKEGNYLEVSAATGKFTFSGGGGDEDQSVGLIAGGVGITPVMAILRCLEDRQWKGEIYLLYCNKTEGDIIFRQEIETLRKKMKNLHVTLTVTRGQDDWTGERGRIDAAMLRRVLPKGKIERMPFYVCGPADMIKGTQEILRFLGVAEENVRTESFGARPAAVDEGKECTVLFIKSRKTGRVNRSRPILELAEELGVPVPSECRSGICGTCKCRMAKGAVTMATQDALTEEDRKNAVILLCQARVVEDVEVEA